MALALQYNICDSKPMKHEKLARPDEAPLISLSGAGVRRSGRWLVRGITFSIAPGVTIPVGGYDFADVSASYSMGAQRRMVAVKGAIMSLLLDAYQRRDRVGMISFRGTNASLILPPTNSVDLAQVHLQEMPTGGRTPLSAGLFKA